MASFSKDTVLRSAGLGLITGAADDDCSAIGTYAQAGAQMGYAGLWTAPVLLPMMVTVVYLSGKLGLVTGQGLFAVLRHQAPRALLYVILTGVIVGNIIEAGADLGGMAAGLGLLLHVPSWVLMVGITALVLAFQVWGTYSFIRNVLRVLALSLLAYTGSAFLSHPELAQVVRGTFVPSLRFDRDTLAIIVAIIGTSLSAYIYTRQSNEEVEEKVHAGKTTAVARRGASAEELRRSWWDVLFGMVFSNLVMYSIMLSTAATLFVRGHHQIGSATEAAEALRPVAGHAAGLLFALGFIAVGFLAVPVMTTGAAYDLCQVVGWKKGFRTSRGKRRSFMLPWVDLLCWRWE